MFNSSNNPRNKNNSINQAITIIGIDCVINGDLHSEKPIRLDGKVIGLVEASSSLIVGVGGTVEGEVKAQHAVIYGMIKGDVFTEQLEIRAEGKIFGNITSQTVQMEAGAQYVGEMKILNNQMQEQLSANKDALLLNPEEIAVEIK